MHSFEADLIAFLVSSCLKWPRHCMHVVYFTLWYEMIKATVRVGAFVLAGARATSTGSFPRSFDSRLALKWSGSVWCTSETSPVYVVVKTCSDWINAVLIKEKSDKLFCFILKGFYTKQIVWKQLNRKIAKSIMDQFRFSSFKSIFFLLKSVQFWFMTITVWSSWILNKFNSAISSHKQTKRDSGEEPKI